jgi:hypothetical protein
MPETPVARVDILPGKLWRLDVAGTLSVDAREIAGRMVKEPGQKVAKDEIMAVGGDYFERRVLRSPAGGSLVLLSRNLGFAYLREDVEVGDAPGPVTLDATKELGVSPSALARFKSPGASSGALVIKGQVLASRRSESGRRYIMVRSPFYGRITEVSRTSGTISLTPLFKSPNITAYLKGRVTRVAAGDGVEVEGAASIFSGVWGLGGEGYGTLHAVDGDLTPELDLPERSVVALSGTASYEGLIHARDAGVAGVVLGYLSSETVVRYAGSAKNMGITGDELVPFPVVLTEGFLPAPMRPETFAAFAECRGLTCSIKGTTHIRAGVIRPEVVISRE